MLHVTTRQPTITAIPGILARAIARTLARIILVLALALLATSIFLATWPSARTPRQQALLDLLLAALALVKSDT